MLNALNTTQKGILSACLGFGAFAVADASAKWLSAHYETLHVIFWTYLISLVFGLIIAHKLGGLKKTLKTKRIFIHVSRGLSAFAIALLVVTGLSKGLPLATMYTILFLAPFLTTIAAIPIYKERVSLRSWFIIALGFSGIIVAFHNGISVHPGAKYALMALAFIVTLGLLARPLNEEESLHSLSFYPAFIVTFLTGTAVLPYVEIPAWEHLPVFLLNGISVTLGLSGIAYGFRLAPYATIAPIHYGQMVIAVLAGYIVFNETPDFWVMCGASIIILSGILLIFNRKR